jgi:hypothetical protein
MNFKTKSLAIRCFGLVVLLSVHDSTTKPADHQFYHVKKIGDQLLR